MHKLGHTIVRLDRAPSTNSLVLANEQYLDQHGLVVVARRQPGGRGRLGRTWHDLPGDQLFASVVAHPRVATADTPAVSLLAGLALAQAIWETAGLQAQLKWPNDAMIRGRKVAGILVEGSPGRNGAPRLVIGIGVNCQGEAGDIPPDLRKRITTLSLEAGRPIDPEAVLQALLPRLDGLLARLAAGERTALLGEWAETAYAVGRWVQFPKSGDTANGIVQGISPEGYLVVEDVAGAQHRIVSGEITWRD
jgi:BirA family biotin operon repressor/biotin-[acetyl-CoA-carboxylase] ligase